MELSHDSGVSLSEGAQHLVRLAEGRSLPLELALADLDRERTPSREREYARTPAPGCDQRVGHAFSVDVRRLTSRVGGTMNLQLPI